MITWVGVTFTAIESAALYYTLGTLATAAIGYSAYQLCDYYDIGFTQSQVDYEPPIYNQEQTNTGNEQGIKGQIKSPPYSGVDLGDDATKCPGEGFEWKGKGEPGNGEGSWYNPNTVKNCILI